MLSIKKATTGDIELIRELTYQVWPQTYTPILGTVQVTYMLNLFYNPDALRQQMDQSGHRFIICFKVEQPVGFASYSDTGSGTFKLHKLYVLPGLQGNGIGPFMLNHITDELKKEGAHSLLLNVNIYNATAKAFYQKVGFKHVKDEDIDIGSGYFMNDHVLRLEL